MRLKLDAVSGISAEYMSGLWVLSVSAWKSDMGRALID